MTELIWTLFWAWAMASGTSAPTMQADSPAAATRSDVRHVAATKSVEDTLCSLDTVDTDLATILQVLSRETKANLVLLASPGTKLTIRLSRVKLIEMIRHICALTNLAFLKVGHTFVIATEAQLQTGYAVEWTAAHPAGSGGPSPQTVMETYLTNYVSSVQIAETLTSIFKDSGLLVVAGPAQVTPNLSFQETSYATGIQSGGLPEETGASEKRGRLLLFRGPAPLVAAAIEAAKKLDVPRPQISIAVTIHDISNEALNELGLSWTYSNINIMESKPRALPFGSFTRAPMNFIAQLKALETLDKAKLLASPNITVLDGEKAFILIGSRLNYPVLVSFSQANTPIYDKQEERVGIYLQVAASVSEDDHITLSLYPQVSVVTGFLEVNGASYPQISTREAQTKLRVTTGETIVMGGMLKDEEITQIEKVPILAEIPILGELFKRRKRTKVSAQVMITITPVVLRPKKNEPG